MLKLNSVNGKFDIVFAGDLLLGGKQKLDFPQASSRSKNTDLKSQVLPKEPVRKAKPKKFSPSKNNEDEKIKKVLPPDKKPSRRTLAKEAEKNTVNNNNNSNEEKIKKVLPPDKKPARKIQGKNSEKPSSRNKTSRTAKSTNKKELEVINKKETNKKEFEVINKKEEQKEVEPVVSSNSRTTQPDANDMFRRSTFQNGGITNHQNVGVISREDLNNMFSGFFEDKTNKSMEPFFAQDSTSPNFLSNSNRSIPRNHQVINREEDYNPWGRPGCGAPQKKKDENVIAGYNSYSSTPGLCQRDSLIRNLQASFNEEYNPWGRPGCGAPLKDKDQNVVADLKSMRTNNRAQSYPGQSQKQTVREDKLQSSFDVKKSSRQFEVKNSSPPQPDVNFSFSSTFARGQGKNQFELDDIQRRRLKELEHQAAIKQQVEEKRRLKRLEKERELKEEQAADERFRKEQAHLRDMAEKERQKQREQEEKMRKKQEMLEESIKKANLEAKKVKESMKRDPPMDKNSGNSRQNRTEEQNFTRRLHHDSDVIIPTKFETNEGAKTSTPENTYNKNEINQLLGESNIGVNTTFTQSPGEPSQRLNGNNLKNENTSKSNRVAASNKQSQQTPSKDSHLKNSLGGAEHPRDSDFEPVFNDYMIPFHRTQTAELLDNSKPLLTSEMKKSSRGNTRDSPKQLSVAEAQPLSDVTSARQQQILSQLHALRQGLMQKEREYVLEKYS